MGVDATRSFWRVVTVHVGSPATELHSFWVTSPNLISLTNSIIFSVWFCEKSQRSSKNIDVVLEDMPALSPPSSSPVLAWGSNSALTSHKQSSSTFQQKKWHLSNTMVNTEDSGRKVSLFQTPSLGYGHLRNPFFPPQLVFLCSPHN